MNEYYGFIEHVDSLEGVTNVQLDALSLEAAERLQATDPALRPRLVEELPTELIEFRYKGPSRYNPTAPNDPHGFAPDRWVKFTLGGEDGLSATRYGDVAARAGQPTRINAIQWLDQRTNAVRLLNESLSLGDIPDATPPEIKSAIWDGRSPQYIAAYDVGQGNCTALCDASCTPMLYFDVGGGCLWNARTYPAGLQLCSASDAPVVLSHWDTDHWVSVRQFPWLLDRTWLVPRQKMGVTHTKLARALAQRNHLLIWPSAASHICVPGTFCILKGTGSSRNDSGLVVLAHIQRAQMHHYLLTGDARYGVLPGSCVTQYDGVITPHHGAKQHHATVPHPIGNRLVVYSYGLNNTFHHPHPKTVADHLAGGWQHRRDVTQGHVFAPSNGATLPTHVCPVGCTLQPAQV